LTYLKARKQYNSKPFEPVLLITLQSKKLKDNEKPLIIFSTQLRESISAHMDLTFRPGLVSIVNK